MTFALSRLMSTATASYGVYALVDPRHLGNAVDPKNAADYDLLAEAYGVRDGVLLSMKAKDDQTRAKVLGVTLGWAALNYLALRADRRRLAKQPRLVA